LFDQYRTHLTAKQMPSHPIIAVAFNTFKTHKVMLRDYALCGFDADSLLLPCRSFDVC
jgi:hypothetical protein